MVSAQFCRIEGPQMRGAQVVGSYQTHVGMISCRGRRARNIVRCTRVLAQGARKADLTALVIGSGFAGLSAAAGLSRCFKHVTILERDVVPFDTTPEHAHESDPEVSQAQFQADVKKRQGIPQYQQPHMLLNKGLQLLEELFPGYCARLQSAGAMHTDYVQDIVAFDHGKEFSTTKPSGLQGLAASRHLLESVLRTFVNAVDNVNVRTGAVVQGVEYNEQDSRLTGVKLKDGQTMHADLVIDASGSSSRMTDWLKDLGHTVAPVMTVDAGLRYTYRMYEMNDDPDRKWNTAFCNTNPQPQRIGVVVPVEGNKWQVNLSGYKGTYCPTDEAGFLEFARKLPSPTIYHALRQAKPLTPVISFAKTRNFRRLYEKVPPPKGLCVVGDAACCFNPINGQGMTVGIMGSHLLCKTVDKQLSKVGSGTRQQQLAALDALPATFHQELGKMLDYPWTIATGVDSKQPGAVVELPEQGKDAVPQWLSSYLRALQQAAYSDDYLMTKMTSVGHMLEPPSMLFMPDVVLRFAWCWLRSQNETLQNKLQSGAKTKPGLEPEA